MASSQEALDLFKKQPEAFDLVLLDLIMPKMTGDTLAKHLIQIRSDIPIIICTGDCNRITHEKAADIGIKRLLLKPLTIREVALGVREALDASA